MFRFASPQYLNLLFIIPVLVIMFFIIIFFRKRSLHKYVNSSLWKELIPDMSVFRISVKFILKVLALSLIIIAIARPQFGSKLREVKRKGIELIIALDVSNSMLAQDIQPNRLERAKMAVSRLVDKLEDDRIGLIVFAGDAYMQVPLTNDITAVKMMLSTINTGIVPKQGTAIGSAIRLANHSFNFNNDLEKAIIVITDGENHEDDPVSAAKASQEKSIKVYTVGLGSAKGAPVPLSKYNSGRFRKDREGHVVISKLNEKSLAEIADAGGGKYISASGTSVSLDKLFDDISKMNAKEIEAEVYSEYDDQFQYFIGLAIILLIMDFIVLGRRNKFLTNINLFKPIK